MPFSKISKSSRRSPCTRLPCLSTTTASTLTMETSTLSDACGMTGVCGAAEMGSARKSRSRQLEERMTFPFRDGGADSTMARMRMRPAILLFLLITAPLPNACVDLFRCGRRAAPIQDDRRLRSSVKFFRSDSCSTVFGVSSSFGMPRKRGSLSRKRNASTPISPVADVLVPVDARAERLLRIVEVKRADVFDADVRRRARPIVRS